MKKTLAAVAVLGAFAGTALAADVTLYGKFDGGLNYTHKSAESQDMTTGHISSANSDSFEARSGQNSGSRFGLRGTEQISDGLTVGFQLESGFDLDSGKLGQGGRIFGREARGYVKTDFGEIGFGRMGGLDSGLGSYDLIHSYILSGGLKLGQECSVYTFLRLSLQKKNVDVSWLTLDELNEYAKNGNEDIGNLDLLYTSELNRPV